MDTPSAALASNQRFAERYILKRRLGLGRLGEVWLADDTRLEMDVALKFFDAIENRDLLETAARRCMKITHPHIVRVYDFVNDERRCALVMEYLQGGSLARKLKEQESGCFEPAAIQDWVKQLWSALAELHEQNISHGNLNLANLGIADTGELKILEAGFFDIRSAALNPDQTFSYLPCLTPQILSGKTPGPMDDSYAGGACVYEMLSGKPVFLGANLPQQIQEREITPVAVRRAEIGVGAQPVPQEWEQWISRCLSKSAYDRPHSSEMRDTLRDAPPVSTTTAEEAAAATRQANSPTAKLGAAKEKLRSLPQQAWIGLGAAAALAVFYFQSWAPAKSALAAMEAEFSTLKLKTLSEAEPPAKLVEDWKGFLGRYNGTIPYTEADTDMLRTGFQMQATVQTAAEDAKRKEEELAQKKADEEMEKQKNLVSEIKKEAETIKTKLAESTEELANAAIAQWQPFQTKLSAITFDSAEITRLRKEVQTTLTALADKAKMQEAAYANYLGNLTQAVADLKTTTLVDTTKGASVKLKLIDELKAKFANPPPHEGDGPVSQLAELNSLSQTWTVNAMNEAPKEPLALAALFAGTAYANLPEDKLKVLLPKVYQSLAVGVEPKDDADRKKLHEAIIKKQTAAGGIPTGALALEDLTKAEIPIPKDEKELTDFVTSLMPKKPSSSGRGKGSSKKTVEEPNFGQRTLTKIKGIFGGGDDKPKPKGKQ